MNPVTRYEKAPITEALLDIRVKGPEPSLEQLATLQAQVGDSYPHRKSLFVTEIEIGSNSADEVPILNSQNGAQRGWAFLSTDKLQIWQVQREGFTFSRLAPYDCWDSFRNEARRLWEITRPVLGPEAVARVALRYINRLELPLPLKDFKDYLRTAPEVSPELPQGLSAYFMQLQIPQDDIRAMIILNQSLLPSPPGREPGTATVLLDIDVSRTRELSEDERGLWSYFEELHTSKNKIFEGCITDRTRELIL